MGRRRGRPPQPPPRARRVDLTHVADTSATTEGPLSIKERRKERNEAYEEIDLPFKSSEHKDKAITWGELSRIWKIGGAIALFFITVVIPVVWFASSLNTNVGTLQSDVKEIKATTAELISNSVKNSQRLDGMEKSISEISRNSSSSNSRAPRVNAPNKPIKPTQ